MLTTIRSARRSRLESAVCVFTVMVCGSLSLLAASDAFALGVDHQRNASAWLSWTAVGTLGDSFVGGACDNDDRDEDDGDNDDGAGAADGVTTVLTADHDQSWRLIASAFDTVSSRRSKGHALRGPPQLTLPNSDLLDCLFPGHTSGALDTAGRGNPDGVGELPAASPLLTTRHDQTRTDPLGIRSLPLPASFDVSAFSADRQRLATAWLSWTADRTFGDSFVAGAGDNDDRDEDDGDNDDGAGAADGVTTVLTADHGQSWHVIASALDAPSSRGSACHSLRGPPRGAIPVPDSIDRPRAGQTAGALDIDDRAKADGVGMLPAASTVLTTHHSHWTNPSGFRRSPQLGSDGISLRGPPQVPRVPRPFGSRPPPEGDAVNRCVQPCEKPQSDEACASGARRVWSVGRSIEWFRQCEREH